MTRVFTPGKLATLIHKGFVCLLPLLLASQLSNLSACGSEWVCPCACVYEHTRLSLLYLYFVPILEI